MRVRMTCGHCLAKFYLLHVGSGDMLCCRCVQVHRMWLYLAEIGVRWGDPYEHRGNPAFDWQHDMLREHVAPDGGFMWCDEALADEPVAIPALAALVG